MEDTTALLSRQCCKQRCTCGAERVICAARRAPCSYIQKYKEQIIIYALLIAIAALLIGCILLKPVKRIEYTTEAPPAVLLDAMAPFAAPLTLNGSGDVWYGKRSWFLFPLRVHGTLGRPSHKIRTLYTLFYPARSGNYSVVFHFSPSEVVVNLWQMIHTGDSALITFNISSFSPTTYAYYVPLSSKALYAVELSAKVTLSAIVYFAPEFDCM